MSTWDRIIELSQKGPVPLKRWGSAHNGLQMVGSDLPISISEREYDYLVKYCQDNKKCTAYDLATAFGISALALAEGGCKVLSIDSYTEELEQNQPTTIDIKPNPEFWNSKGYKSAEYLTHNDWVFLKCAVAPNDTESVIKNHVTFFGLFNIILFDCPKSDDSFIIQFDHILLFCTNNVSIFVHDTHVYDGRAEAYIKSKGFSWTNVMPDQQFPFVLVERI